MASILKDETYAKKRGGQSLRRRNHGRRLYGQGGCYLAQNRFEGVVVPNTMRTRGSKAKGSLSICVINGDCKIISPMERAGIQGGQI